MCIAIGDVKNSKLMALFSALEEKDKDIVISMTELLVKRHGNIIDEHLQNEDG